MSNKEENGTKDILDSSSYRLWKQQLYLLLKEKKLEQHVLRELIKKVSCDKLSEEKKKSLTLVDGTTDIY